jgi:hypothetical protein
MQRLAIIIASLCFCVSSFSQIDSLRYKFKNPPESAKPWVFWYWIKAAVTRDGITADLEAMKQNGIGGVYLVPIQGAANPPLVKPAIVQLTPEWWAMLRFAFEEANRLGLQIAMHSSDGFATAGGPWITPELSMQKVVWSETRVSGGMVFNDTLTKPQAYKGYYRDIAVLAFPTPDARHQSTFTVTPKISTSNDSNASFLISPASKGVFKSEDPCWILYEFEQPFTCRSVTIANCGTNYQAHRLKVEASNDGISFRQIAQLNPPRHGWLDYEDDVTYSIETTTARFFRFSYTKEGSEPASEDLENAKWKPMLKLRNLYLSSTPVVNQFEGKNGQVWRVGQPTSAKNVTDSLCVDMSKLVDLTRMIDANGRLHWNVPAGNWVILRIGHTSTGHENGTAGGGKGLECDKLNPATVEFQYKKWFGEIQKKLGKNLTSKVLKYFHVDSWECGSQNWSPYLAEEFRKRRGYDMTKFLPVVAGYPVTSANVSEKFLYDYRQTIAELVNENFYGTLSRLAHADGYLFTAEAVAPVMLSDGMAHYKYADVPMGEFWVKSPSHDKPQDMIEAVSGAHIYGKNIIQAEGFTTLRMDWSENPASLKTLQDRNYALGINRLVYHVCALNPWLDFKPGVTLDGVGLYFQRDQTWWKPGKAWVEYAQRCQAMLQQGKPVADVAVFVGEEYPRRVITPDRLVPVLPGIIGNERVSAEKQRCMNKGVPTQSASMGLTLTANIYNPDNWVDPLRGYAYDSFNPEALMMSKVSDGRIVLPGGASYSVLVVPDSSAMNPTGNVLSAEVSKKLEALMNEGATIVMAKRPGSWKTTRGTLLPMPYTDETFEKIGVTRDFFATDSVGLAARDIAWTHRAGKGYDIYFISNQQLRRRNLTGSFRTLNSYAEIWNPENGQMSLAAVEKKNGRTEINITLEANESVFVILSAINSHSDYKSPKGLSSLGELSKNNSWQVSFNPKYGGPSAPVTFSQLTDWSQNADSSIRYYSGTATYTQTIICHAEKGRRVWLCLGKVANIAQVWVNGAPCGVAWTYPFRVEITGALNDGQNQLLIEVSNTWANRLIGDKNLPENKRVTLTTAPFRLEGKPLLEAGLLGPVELMTEDK